MERRYGSCGWARAREVRVYMTTIGSSATGGVGGFEEGELHVYGRHQGIVGSGMACRFGMKDPVAPKE